MTLWDCVPTDNPWSRPNLAGSANPDRKATGAARQSAYVLSIRYNADGCHKTINGSSDGVSDHRELERAAIPRAMLGVVVRRSLSLPDGDHRRGQRFY